MGLFALHKQNIMGDFYKHVYKPKQATTDDTAKKTTSPFPRAVMNTYFFENEHTVDTYVGIYKIITIYNRYIDESIITIRTKQPTNI